jgi:photosystem II stability/assembly factor-like uncharacterized protein
MSLLTATQVTAIATAVLAALAIVTAVFAILAFRTQSEQLAEQEAVNRQQAEVLDLQAKELRESLDERKREAVERRGAQAQLVAATLGAEERSADGPEAGRTATNLINSSPEPVWALVIAIVLIQGAAPATTEAWLELRKRDPAVRLPITTVSTLPAGKHRVWVRGTAWAGLLSGRAGVEVAFTDRASNHWIRRAKGQLEPLPEDPIEYFRRLGLYGPHDLQTPEMI